MELGLAEVCAHVLGCINVMKASCTSGKLEQPSNHLCLDQCLSHFDDHSSGGSNGSRLLKYGRKVMWKTKCIAWLVLCNPIV